MLVAYDQENRKIQEGDQSVNILTSILRALQIIHIYLL